MWLMRSYLSCVNNLLRDVSNDEEKLWDNRWGIDNHPTTAVLGTVDQRPALNTCQY